MTAKKSFDKELDDLLTGIELPSEEEITEETRKEKISKTSSGKQKPAGFSEKLSATKKGKTHSEEHRANNSKAQKGKKLSDEHRAKVSAAGIGHKVSDETRAKIGAANKGRKLPPPTEQAIINRREAQKLSYLNGRIGGMKGKKQSDEVRLKMSNARKGKTNSQETRAKISESKKGKAYGGNLKSVITPFGIFLSIKEAGEYEEKITGKKFNRNRLSALLKIPNSGYKKI